MKKLLFGILAVCLVLCMCACNTETEESTANTSSAPEAESSTVIAESSVEEAESSAAENTATFLVKTVDADGNAVAGVMVQICKDTCIPAKTDDSGVATFNIEITEGYKLSVLSCPEGYEYTGEAEVYLESGATEITVELSAKG